MLCCLFDLIIDAQATGVISGKDTPLPITVISHREGSKNYQKAPAHGDPEELWLLYKNLHENDFKGRLDDYLKKETSRVSTEYLQKVVMDPFRQEVSDKIDYYKKYPNKIHPLLLVMYYYSKKSIEKEISNKKEK